ncbi:MAG: outer membrane beta-barrel protein [Bacteroidia bacterium]|jgi:hypothetical protein|nr:outer membrane beta-barrel protein [Bacteroidia bacterium]
MKYLFTFLFSFYVCHLSAQSKFGLGVFTSFDATGMIGEGFYAMIGQDGYNRIAFGYQYGLRMRYQFNSTISLHAGISHVTHQLRTSRVYLNFRDKGDPLIPSSYIRMPALRMIQIPLMASFYKGNKLKLGGSLGFAYNYTYQYDDRAILYFGNHEEQYLVERKLTEKNQFVSGQLGVGLEYWATKFAFRVEPNFSCQLFYFNNTYANKNYNLYAVGLNLSSFYFF